MRVPFLYKNLNKKERGNVKMFNQIVNTVVPVLVTAIGGILVAIIKSVGDAAIDYIQTKKEHVANQIGDINYNSNLKKAKDIWNIVDEEFRITPTLTKTVEAKQQMFAKLLKSKVPSLTDDEISSIRQAIAGEVNKGKAVVTSDAVAKQKELEDAKAQNVQLVAENEQLKKTLETIQNTAAVKTVVK